MPNSLRFLFLTQCFCRLNANCLAGREPNTCQNHQSHKEIADGKRYKETDNPPLHIPVRQIKVAYIIANDSSRQSGQREQHYSFIIQTTPKLRPTGTDRNTECQFGTPVLRTEPKVPTIPSRIFSNRKPIIQNRICT